MTAPVDTHNGKILQQNAVRCYRRYSSACEPDTSRRPDEAMHFVGQVKDIAADRIVDHIGPAPACEALHLIDPAWVAIIDDVFGALACCEFQFFR